MRGDDFMDTEAVAKYVGTTPAYIRNILSRYPELRPKRKFGDQWMFTQEEADRLRDRPKGRRRKQ